MPACHLFPVTALVVAITSQELGDNLKKMCSSMKGEGHTTHIFGKVGAQEVADRFEVCTLVSLSGSCVS